MKRARIVWAGLLWAGLLLPATARTEAVAFKPYDPIVRKIAQKHGIDPVLIHAIIRAESNYDSFAVSEKGAMGLMQLMPDTAKTYGVNNYYDPEENIEGGTKFLKDLIKLFDGKTDKVLAAYNAGQEAVKKYKGIPPYPETRTYIRRIQASYKYASIRTRTEIYRYYDGSGCLVLTNDRRLYELNKAD